MLPVISRTINGRSYETTTLAAEPGRKVFLRVLKVLGHGAQAAGDRINKGTWAAGVSGMAGAIERLSDEDMTFFVDAFSQSTTVQVEGGNRLCVKDIYPLHFAGKMKEHMQWLLFCIEANFSDFFGDARTQLAEIWEEVLAQVTKTASASNSPTTSIGGSGDSSPVNESP